MMVADTDVLIDFLEGRSPAAERIALELDRGQLRTTVITRFELLAGAKTPRQLKLVGELLPRLPMRGLADFESAAELYRACRRRGGTVRKLVDCLIAAVAVRENATVLHNDGDFEVLARHTRLRTERYRVLRAVPSR
jgi:predicted nucleic acid-binding protein